MMKYLPHTLSLAALVVAVFGLVREPARAPAPAATGDARYDQLATEVRMLRATLAQRDARPNAAAMIAAVTPDPATPSTATPPPAVPTAKLVHFEAPRGLAITADDRDSVVVKNDDPSLTGKVMQVEAERDDGTKQMLTIVVPPPER